MTESVRASGSAMGGRTGQRGVAQIGMATALASALLVGASNPAPAADPELNLNRVWAGCVLNPTTVTGLVADLETSGVGTEDADPEIAFVLVYSLNNDNDGQPAEVDETQGFTGPVLCLNEDLNLDETVDLGIETTTQTTPIPAIGTANFLDTEDVFIVRYELDDESGTIEKVLCHTVKSNTDCFRISPDLAP